MFFAYIDKEAEAKLVHTDNLDGTNDATKRRTAWKSSEILQNTRVQYDFDGEVELEGFKIRWYKDNGSNGGIKLPKSFEIYYKNSAGTFVKVSHEDKYEASSKVPLIAGIAAVAVIGTAVAVILNKRKK